jgi:hypothetical protein
LKVQNFEKAKLLLKKAYQLKKKCLISPEITKKLQDVLNVIRSQREMNIISNDAKEQEKADYNERLYKINEKQGDSYCNLAIYELGLRSYFKQVLSWF